MKCAVNVIGKEAYITRERGQLIIREDNSVVLLICEVEIEAPSLNEVLDVFDPTQSHVKTMAKRFRGARDLEYPRIEWHVGDIKISTFRKTTPYWAAKTVAGFICGVRPLLDLAETARVFNGAMDTISSPPPPLKKRKQRDRHKDDKECDWFAT